jgi:hypothetical protein
MELPSVFRDSRAARWWEDRRGRFSSLPIETRRKIVGYGVVAVIVLIGGVWQLTSMLRAPEVDLVAQEQFESIKQAATRTEPEPPEPEVQHDPSRPEPKSVKGSKLPRQ